jgi:hypothetical protein
MRMRSLPRRKTSHWLARIGALVAVVGQLAVSGATLNEARQGASTAAHVEMPGTSVHYAHNGSDCAVCQARLIQGIVGRPADVPVAVTVLWPTFEEVDTRVVSAGLGSSRQSRAPPLV